MKAGWIVLAIVLLSSPALDAQRGRAGGAPPPTGQAAAGADFTGYWVSLVTEDWRWRMMVAPPGDHPSIPLNQAGRDLAATWDPAKETAEDKCKAYGGAGIMRIPTRLNVSWENPTTLKIDTDAGTQTRRFVFGGRVAGPLTTAAAGPSLQGTSVATWQYGGGRGARAGGPVPPGQLKVVTTNMTPGYLQRNGVPYSANAVVTEYFNLLNQPDGGVYMVVTTIVDDPTYLNVRMARSSHFKKEADGSKFKPVPCD